MRKDSIHDSASHRPVAQDWMFQFTLQSSGGFLGVHFLSGVFPESIQDVTATTVIKYNTVYLFIYFNFIYARTRVQCQVELCVLYTPRVGLIIHFGLILIT